MIKCFIVENLDNETPRGNFNKNSYYIAKLTNKPNTFSVLDEDQNWIPFKWHSKTSELSINHCRLYFYILENFIIENKKELNKYITDTEFYKINN